MLHSKFSIRCLFAFTLLFSSPAFTEFDNGARFAFTASVKEKSIYVIDMFDRKLVKRINLDTAPDSVAASENLKALVVAHRPSKRLTLIDLTAEELTRIDYPLTISPDYLAVSPLGETVAVYDKSKQVLQVHAIRRNQVLLNLNGVRTVSDFTFSLDGSSLYWVDDSSGTFHSVDLWSKRNSLLLTGHGDGLSAVSRSIDGLLGFISDSMTNKVTVINLKTFKKLTDVYVGGKPGRAWGTTDGQLMLVPNFADSTVTAISTANLKVIYTMPVVSEPVSIHSGWLDTIAAVVGKGGEVAFIDINSGQVKKSLSLGGSPTLGLVTSDSKTLAIPVPKLGVIKFFDMRTHQILGSIGDLPSDIGQASLAISNNLCH